MRTIQQVVDLVERLAPTSTLAVNLLPKTDRPGHPCRRDYGGVFIKRFTAPTTDNDVTERLPDDSNGNNVYLLKQPRVCNECCLQTTKVLCPRCGGQTDIDETSDYYCPSDPDTVVNSNVVKREGHLINGKEMD